MVGPNFSWGNDLQELSLALAHWVEPVPPVTSSDRAGGIQTLVHDLSLLARHRCCIGRAPVWTESPEFNAPLRASLDCDLVARDAMRNPLLSVAHSRSGDSSPVGG